MHCPAKRRRSLKRILQNNGFGFPVQENEIQLVRCFVIGGCFSWDPSIRGGLIIRAGPDTGERWESREQNIPHLAL